MTPKVIDLSHYNAIQTDLHDAKASGVIGCIHKATEGLSPLDAKCAARHYLAKQAGMLWGLYHFMRPVSVPAQLDYFLKSIENVSDQNTLLALDFEVEGVSVDDALWFLDNLAVRTGRAPTLYSGHTLKEALSNPYHAIHKYRLWLADYTPPATLPVGYSKYFLWQYTDSAAIPGLATGVDASTYDGTDEQLAAEWSGAAQAVVPVVPPVDASSAIGISIMKPPTVPLHIWVNGELAYNK